MSWFSKILIVFVFVVSLSFISLTSISAHEGHVHAETLGEIILETGASSGSSFTVTVYEDSGSEMVNAVQANLMFPVGLTAKVNATGSVFDIEAEQENVNGMVKIARGTVSPVSGKQKVASVTFSGTGNPSDIIVSEDSAIIRSSDSKNIYAKSQNYYADESIMNTESSSNPVVATSAAQPKKSGFFSKIAAWNNSLWDRILGLFSKN